MKLTKEQREYIRNQLKEVNQELFYALDWQSPEDGEGPNTFALGFRERDLTFEDLLALSNAFGTTNINVGTENRDDGYCETCSNPYSLTVVYIKNATKGLGA